MIKNLTKNAEFYCLCHKEPVLLKMRERTDDTHDNFYACPKYMRKDNEHPDGFDTETGEHGCTTRLSLTDAGEILYKFNEKCEDTFTEGSFGYLTGSKFKVKKINVKVLEHNDDVVKFGIDTPATRR